MATLFKMANKENMGEEVLKACSFIKSDKDMVTKSCLIYRSGDFVV